MTGAAGDATVVVHAEELMLMAERTVFWSRAGTLLVADAHWGKAAAFRSLGVPVPRGTTLGGLTRLDRALARTGAQRVVYLGDFLHAREGRALGTLDALADWRSRHTELELVLVRGNHDVRAGDPPSGVGVRCVDGALLEPPFVLTHHPRVSPDGYVLAGHMHPAAHLQGPGRQRARLPCFWFSRDVAVLPSFGDFTGYADVTPRSGDRVFVIAEDRVLEVG